MYSYILISFVDSGGGVRVECMPLNADFLGLISFFLSFLFSLLPLESYAIYTMSTT